jgi:hypothetical protein
MMTISPATAIAPANLRCGIGIGQSRTIENNQPAGIHSQSPQQPDGDCWKGKPFLQLQQFLSLKSPTLKILELVRTNESEEEITI